MASGIDLTKQGGGTIRLENFSVDDLDATDFAFYEASADIDGCRPGPCGAALVPLAAATAAQGRLQTPHAAADRAKRAAACGASCRWWGNGGSASLRDAGRRLDF